MATSSKPRLLILGDVMLDLYTWGTAERVSPEAPVLVLRADREEARLGGAGAVAGLLAALGAQALVAGLVGDDLAGRRVARLIADLGQSFCRERPPWRSAVGGFRRAPSAFARGLG
jgi:D-beta-D-heptose 7-phosphate kinase / D-beta-D-heptose 1-phosphate adenosyltransferase